MSLSSPNFTKASEGAKFQTSARGFKVSALSTFSGVRELNCSTTIFCDSESLPVTIALFTEQPSVKTSLLASFKVKSPYCCALLLLQLNKKIKTNNNSKLAFILMLYFSFIPRFLGLKITIILFTETVLYIDFFILLAKQTPPTSSIKTLIRNTLLKPIFEEKYF